MATKTPKPTRRAAPRDDYMDLIRQFPLRRIRSDDENDDALRITDRLILSGPEGSLSEGQQTYLDALRVLIAEYESTRYPIKRSTPLQRLKAIVEESQTTQAKFATILGIKQPAASLILAGKRSLTPESIRKLADHYGVSTDYFL